jgi:hypothetical protein
VGNGFAWFPQQIKSHHSPPLREIFHSKMSEHLCLTMDIVDRGEWQTSSSWRRKACSKTSRLQHLSVAGGGGWWNLLHPKRWIVRRTNPRTACAHPRSFFDSNYIGGKSQPTKRNRKLWICV